MADSDSSYDASDDDTDAIRDSTVHGTRSTGPVGGLAGSSKEGDNTVGNPQRKAAWENVDRSWEKVVVGADGNIDVDALREAEQRRRLLRDTTPIQRGIIRHLILVLDLSFAMVEKDLRPTRHLLTIRYASEFITEYFEQNPISQLGIIGMRDGLAVRISDMSGNATDHIANLKLLQTRDPLGNPSLQNALEMARAALFQAPSHGTREVLIIYGALLSSDPGDIHETISNLVQDRIRVSVIGLAAQVAICAELCSRTNAGEDGHYGVALNEQHFRELVMALTTPPATRTTNESQASLLRMGFPSRTSGAGKTMSFCACHNKLTSGGYLCSRCETKVCSLPADCPVCGLTLVLSTHLARSYHHLFPLRNWVAISWSEAAKSEACFACLTPFKSAPKDKGKAQENMNADGGPKGTNDTGRYACEVCNNHFCIDCDVFAHEVLHNCAGCQSDSRGTIQKDTNFARNGHAANGDAMEE